MNADLLDDALVQVLDEQDDYVQILGVETEGAGEGVEVDSFGIDGGDSVFIDIDSTLGDDESLVEQIDVLSE